MAIPASFLISGGPPTSDSVLTIVLTRVDDSIVCFFAGELDLSNETRVRKALDEVLARRPVLVAVELSGVRLFTSSALNALLAARITALALGIPIVLASPSRIVERVLQISQTDQVFPAYPTLDEALDHGLEGDQAVRAV
ncbi:STAS domain-containing protein [Kitasatospora sp. NPDC085895]|uniref:STAS domain-containing protein n=1 Tax=Kitasatospora sp. NPDC085895 TaxID=3155057 RepID=UPI00344D94D8